MPQTRSEIIAAYLRAHPGASLSSLVQQGILTDAEARYLAAATQTRTSTSTTGGPVNLDESMRAFRYALGDPSAAPAQGETQSPYYMSALSYYLQGNPALNGGGGTTPYTGGLGDLFGDLLGGGYGGAAPPTPEELDLLRAQAEYYRGQAAQLPNAADRAREASYLDALGLQLQGTAQTEAIARAKEASYLNALGLQLAAKTQGGQLELGQEQLAFDKQHAAALIALERERLAQQGTFSAADLKLRTQQLQHQMGVDDEALRQAQQRIDLDRQLGLGQLQLGQGRLALDTRAEQFSENAAIAEARANPRRTLETIFLQASANPTDTARALQGVISGGAFARGGVVMSDRGREPFNDQGLYTKSGILRPPRSERRRPHVPRSIPPVPVEPVERAAGGVRILRKKGRRPISFREGGEHETIGVPAGRPISAAMHEAAAAGRYGPKAQRQERFRRNILTGPKRAATGSLVGPDGYDYGLRVVNPGAVAVDSPVYEALKARLAAALGSQPYGPGFAYTPRLPAVPVYQPYGPGLYGARGPSTARRQTGQTYRGSKRRILGARTPVRTAAAGKA